MQHPRPRRGPSTVFARLPLACGLMMVCGAWLMSGGCASPPESLVTPEVSDLGYAPVWATDLGLSSRQRVHHATVLGDLLMLTETPTPRLTAVELDTGEIRWRRKLGDGVFPLSMPVLRDEDIIVVQDASRVAILDANDAELQAYQNLQNTLSSDPVLAGNELIYGSLNGVATAHDLELGFPKWRYALPYEIVARPAIRENRVVVVDEGGTYAMLNAEDGMLIWRGRAFEGITATPRYDEHRRLFTEPGRHALRAGFVER